MKDYQKIFNELAANYASAKDALIIRPLYTENIKETTCRITISDDCALALYLLLSDDENRIESVQIPTWLLDEWNVTEKAAFDQALKNTESRYAAVYTDDLFNDQYKSVREFSNKKNVNVLLVTTSRKTNGAISMFYPDTVEKIAAGLNSSFYAAFTSIHECMIHPVGTIEPKAIKRNVTETNRIFGTDDTFSNSVFFYDKDEKTFKVIAW